MIKYRTVRGWFAEGDADFIKRILLDHPTQEVSVIEVGSLFGRSAVAWHEAAKEVKKTLRLHCIDSWAEDAHTDGEPHLEVYDTFLHNTIHLGITHERIPHQTPIIWNDYTPPFTPDIVFYDADHNYDSTINSIRFWHNYTRTILVDDMQIAGTIKAVNVFAKETNKKTIFHLGSKMGLLKDTNV